MNKQTAAELALSKVTAKVHRAYAMQKMGAKTLAHHGALQQLKIA
jgi:FixJ family two-component response regulator